jgi:hypothetical protein
MNILIIILGSNVNTFLQDRLYTAVNFASLSHPTDKIDWFLTGGVKNYETNVVSEAEKMGIFLNTHEFVNLCYQNKNKYSLWNFIYDVKSTNTAENFMRVKRLIEEKEENGEEKYSKIYVITSNFHHNRAKKILDMLIPDNYVDWILSHLQDESSAYWETIHIKNVESDVENAKQKFSKEKRYLRRN